MCVFAQAGSASGQAGAARAGGGADDEYKMRGPHLGQLSNVTFYLQSILCITWSEYKFFLPFSLSTIHNLNCFLIIYFYFFNHKIKIKQDCVCAAQNI